MMYTDSCVEIVKRAIDGDKEAQAELIKITDKMVFSWIHSYVRDYNDVNDLAQDVFVQVILKIHQLKNPSAFLGWLKKMTFRTVYNFIRYESYRKTDSIPQDSIPQDNYVKQDVSILADLATDPIKDAIQGELKAKMHEAVESLCEKDKKLIRACHYEEQSLKEMSVRFNMPLGTVKSSLHYARNNLREILKA